MRKSAVVTFCILLALGLVSSEVLGQKDDPRGVYFPKKAYIDEPLPTFEAAKDRLPSPVLDGNPEYVELYWFCWKLAFTHLKKPLPQSGLVSNYLDESFSPNIFQWDTIFMIMFARYGHHVFPAVQSLDNFYARQHRDGFICREIKEQNGEDYHPEWESESVNPPLFSWAEMESFRVTGDKSRFEAVAPALAKYTEWLETARKRKNTAHGLYWNNGLGSGMDNTPRRGSGWVDMSCQMVMQYKDLAAMYEVLGRDDQAAQYRARAEEIGARINKWMWNEADGLYYDVDDRGQQVKWKTAGCFWPMLAGITSPAQEEKLIANLKDPNSFWRRNVFPTLAADQRWYNPSGGYWHGGVWAPTNYAIIRGLSLTGHHDFAREATLKYLTEIYKVYKDTGTVWELYGPDRSAPGTNGDGLTRCRPDFVGWTGDGPIAMLIENVIGLQADAVNRRLTWHLGRADRFGIERFRFGDITVSLISAPRASVTAPATIAVTADQPFTLIVVNHGVEKNFELTPGEHKLAVE
jgi:glycogen debranching enzyme